MKTYLSCLVLAVCVLYAAGAEESSPSTNAWNRSVELGLNMAKGNSDNLLFTYGATAHRDRGLSVWDLQVNGSHGQNKGELSADKADGSAEYDRQFAERKYLAFKGAAAYDTMADLHYRFVASPGFKYFFVKEPITRLQGEVGPSYIWQKEGDEAVHHPALRLAERFEHNVGEDDLFWHSLEYLPDIYKGNGFLLRIEVGLESGIWQGLTMKWVLRDEFNSQPAVDKDKNDLSLVASVKYKF